VQALSLHSLMRERESLERFVLLCCENRVDEESFVYGELYNYKLYCIMIMIQDIELYQLNTNKYL